MRDMLVITGGVFQLIGLSLVFAELAAIRAHEWGIVPPWTQLWLWSRARAQRALGQFRASRLGRKLGLYRSFAQILPYMSSSSISAGSATLTVTKRPSPLNDDATDVDRIAWLERYVKDQDDDLARLAERIPQEREIAVQLARQEDAAFRQELAVQAAERRSELRWSVRRQFAGTVCVVLGVILTTISAVA